jgi:cyclophilin family peptidyl-prolyl cis-trans isomerase
MLKRILAASAVLLVIHSSAASQTMRFETNVGSFDMVLNPTNDPNLRPLVDNIVAYIGLGRYHFSAVNRAADGTTPAASDDFVLQMGGFMGFPPVPGQWASLHTAIEKLNDGVTVDADGDGEVDFNALSNTRGTVSLALQAGNPNSGTSSFFINLGSNAFLDDQGFVPFARIENMATIDRIMSLTQEDLSQEAGQPGSLAYTDVPLADDGLIVVVKDVEVISAAPGFSFVGPIASALDLASRDAPAAASLTASSADESLEALVAEDLPIGGEALSVSSLGADSAAINAAAIPEPSTIALGALGIFASLMASRRRAAR